MGSRAALAERLRGALVSVARLYHRDHRCASVRDPVSYKGYCALFEVLIAQGELTCNGRADKKRSGAHGGAGRGRDTYSPPIKRTVASQTHRIVRSQVVVQ